MTIKQLIKQGKLVSEVDTISFCSAINVGFLTLDGREDEVQLDVENHISTRAGAEELSELFKSLTKELNTKVSNVIYCTIVGSALTMEELQKMEFYN